MSDHLQKIAMIGLGRQSQSELIPMLLKTPEVEIVAFCDSDPKSIQEFKQQSPNESKASFYQDYTQLFQDVSEDKLLVDALVVCVPHYAYAEIIRQAIKLKIPVFKEKPFALNIEEATKLSQLALAHDVPIYTVTKRQFYPSYRQAGQLIARGELGQVYMYQARHFIPHGTLYQGWRSSRQFAGGGVLLDLGYHLLDLLLLYFGEVAVVQAGYSNVAKPGYSYEVEDAASLFLEHQSGVHGIFQLAALSGPKEEGIEVRGTAGHIFVSKQELIRYDVSGKLVERLELEADGIEANQEAFNQFIKQDRTFWQKNLTHNLNIMKVLAEVYS